MSSNDQMSHWSMVHPELIRKWEQVFVFCNAGDRDTPLTQNRMETIRQNFLSHGSIPAEKGRQAAEMFQDIWATILGDKQSVTLEEFTSHYIQSHIYHAGTRARAIILLHTRMFDCVDLNSDGLVDKDEFRAFSQASGFSNNSSIERAFKAIDVNQDGWISLDEYIDAYVKYDLDAAVKLEDLPMYGLPSS